MKRLTAFLLGTLCVLATLVPAHAVGQANDVINKPLISAGPTEMPSPVIDRTKKGTVTLHYTEDTDGNDPIVGAEFVFYKVANIGNEGQYLPVVDGIDMIDGNTAASDIVEAVLSSYKENQTMNGRITYRVVTDSDGIAVGRNMELGLYVAVEDIPAENHFTTTPFFASVPYTHGNVWIYEAEAEPKPLPGGNLEIEKRLSGNNTEKDREFHFEITLNGYDRPVDYVKNSGAEGQIEGTGTITLKGGETATIKRIPVGVTYSIKETEADQDGYVTEMTGETGVISRKIVAQAVFTNTRNSKTTPPPVDTGDTRTDYYATAVFAAAFVLLLTAVAMKRKRKITA